MSQIDQPIKAGETARMEINGHILLVEPIPYGRLKKLYKLVFSAIEKVGSMDSSKVMEALPDLFEENLEELIELSFDKAKHPFLNKKWVEDNLNLITIKAIGEKMIAVNGIKDFLGQRGKATVVLPPQAGAGAGTGTPLPSPASITS